MKKETTKKIISKILEVLTILLWLIGIALFVWFNVRYTSMPLKDRHITPFLWLLIGSAMGCVGLSIPTAMLSYKLMD